MAIDPDKLRNWKLADVTHRYTARDTILYALGVGLGGDPVDSRQLRYVYERDLLALPSMAVVLGYPGFWLKDPATGVDWAQVLHVGQTLRLHAPLPPAGEVVGTTRVTGLSDKGAGKGALLTSAREIRDRATGKLLATLAGASLLRGDGGFGGASEAAAPPHPLPSRAPDMVCDLPTLPQAALIYRLSGDYNPLHADPEVARRAGFERPILHGLCTLGVAAHALLREACGYDAGRLRALDVRFSAPVYPGETIRTEMWREGDVISFRAGVPARGVLALNHGRAEVA
jgi:acyl dehydratase